MLADEGPTRCPLCADRNRQWERARRKKIGKKELSRLRKISWALHREENRVRRSAKYKSRARPRECLGGCGEVLPTRRGPHRCPSCRDAHAKAYYAAKNASWVRENPILNRLRSMRRYALVWGSTDRITDGEWLAVKATYDNHCLCCRKQEPEISLEPDHIVPLSKHGVNRIENIQPLCRSCNARKRTKTIDYRPDWLDSL